MEGGDVCYVDLYTESVVDHLFRAGRGTSMHMSFPFPVIADISVPSAIC